MRPRLGFRKKNALEIDNGLNGLRSEIKATLPFSLDDADYCYYVFRGGRQRGFSLQNKILVLLRRHLRNIF